MYQVWFVYYVVIWDYVICMICVLCVCEAAYHMCVLGTALCFISLL